MAPYVDPNPPSGPGLLYASSKITQPDALTPASYTDFYTSKHIPDVLVTSGVHSASFYTNIDPAAERPFLALYHLPDLAFTTSKPFQQIRNTYKDDGLPGSGVLYDFANFDVRNYAVVQEFRTEGRRGRNPCLLIAAFYPTGKVSEKEIDDWYQKEHLPLLSKIDGYVCTSRYKLTFAKNNVSSSEATPTNDQPFHLVSFHEFANFDGVTPGTGMAKELQKTMKTDWAKKISAGVKADAKVYKLEKHFPSGDGSSKSNL